VVFIARQLVPIAVHGTLVPLSLQTSLLRVRNSYLNTNYCQHSCDP